MEITAARFCNAPSSGAYSLEATSKNIKNSGISISPRISSAEPTSATFYSARIQEYFNRKSVAANVALESGVQECIESLQDLKANNAEESYLKDGILRNCSAKEIRLTPLST